MTFYLGEYERDIASLRLDEQGIENNLIGNCYIEVDDEDYNLAHSTLLSEGFYFEES